MHDDRIDAGLFHQHDVLREFLRQAAFHRVTAIFHDNDLVVVLQYERQRFNEHACGRAPARKPAQISFARGGRRPRLMRIPSRGEGL